MPLLHILILALVQGITEFLPISSSGHLVMTWELFDLLGWRVPEESAHERLLLDIAAHFGTLLAVCIYFRRDLGVMVAGALGLLLGRMSPGGRLAILVALGSVPVAIVGLLAKDLVIEALRSPLLIGWATMLGGIFLWLCDRFGMRLRRLEHLTWRAALAVGLAQMLALIPGVSRSGITMTAARALGFEREESARISLLLAIPVILGASAVAFRDLMVMGNAAISANALFTALFAFAAALLAIEVMMRWLRRASFTPFVIYRIFMGSLLIWLVSQGVFAN